MVESGRGGAELPGFASMRGMGVWVAKAVEPWKGVAEECARGVAEEFVRRGREVARDVCGFRGHADGEGRGASGGLV